jgi:hypothetical protein
MMAGLMLPARPVGNMYFAAWSHNVILETVNLSNDLKMGEYRTYHFTVPSIDTDTNPLIQSRSLPVSCSLHKYTVLYLEAS